MSSRRTIVTTALAVASGDLIRRVVLAALGYPILSWPPFVGLALAAFAGALAGLALVLGQSKRVPALVLLSLGAALIDQSVLLGVEVLGGASLEAIRAEKIALQLGVEGLGVLAFVAFTPRPVGQGKIGYVLYALSRMGPAHLDVWWLVDAAGVLSTFMRLTAWHPGRARSLPLPESRS